MFFKIKKLTAKEKKNRIETSKMILYLSVGIAAVLFALFSSYGLIKRFQLEIQISDLNKQKHAQKKVVDSLAGAVERLEKDTLEIERIARENYGMVKKNEKVYFIELDDK